MSLPPQPIRVDLSEANLWYRLGWHFFRFLFKLYFDLQIYSAENVPLKGPAIVASNHASFLDPPVIGCASPRPLYYLARESLFKYPILGAIIRSWHGVPVARDRASPRGLKVALDLLEAGKAILVFPEGTRSPNGQLQPARPGIGILIAMSGAPLVPVRVIGSYEALPRGKCFPRPTQIAVLFGKPLSTQQWHLLAKQAKPLEKKKIYHLAASWAMEQIAELKVQ